MTGAVRSIFGGSEGAPAQAAEAIAPEAAAPEAGPANQAIEARTGDVALREQSLGQRAAAAGATRSGNDADLLGYVLPKKRTASRTILG